MTKLAHQVLDDDRVLVSFVGRDAIRVTAAEARRFAWSILADLAPDEAAVEAEAAPKPAKPKRSYRQHQVLDALSRGLRTSTAIGADLGLTGDAVFVHLWRLAKHGFAEQLTRGRPCHPARWTITDAGKTELAALQLDRAA